VRREGLGFYPVIHGSTGLEIEITALGFRCADHATPPLSAKVGSVGIVRSQTKAMQLLLILGTKEPGWLSRYSDWPRSRLQNLFSCLGRVKISSFLRCPDIVSSPVRISGYFLGLMSGGP
jgi:hypothetical protein